MVIRDTKLCLFQFHLQPVLCPLRNVNVKNVRCFSFDALQNPSMTRICRYVEYLYFWIRGRIKIQYGLRAVGVNYTWLSLILSLTLLSWISHGGILFKPPHWEQRHRNASGPWCWIVRCQCLFIQCLGLWEGRACLGNGIAQYTRKNQWSPQ